MESAKERQKLEYERGEIVIFQRFYNEELAHAAYLVGCPKAGEAIVIDANRDLDPIIEFATKKGLKITAITETHIHADYVSGSKELAERTGGRLYLSDEGTEDWKYTFADAAQAKLIRGGDSIWIGKLEFEVLHTPGHTPEHLSFLLYDHKLSESPIGLFTGDFLFVGDVGRPDLLERAAGFEGTMEAGAKVLFSSVSKTLSRLPENLQVWPAHGSGSACGKALGGLPMSVLGFEKQTNWGLRVKDEANFVQEVLEGQPEPPAYFKEMKRINKEGPKSMGKRPPIALLDAHDLDSNLVLIDIRASDEAAMGAIKIPMNDSFLKYAGSLVSVQDTVVLVGTEAQATHARDLLALIGIDTVLGYLPEAEATESLEVNTLEGKTLLDVRGRSERNEEPSISIAHIPLAELPQRWNELDSQKTYVTHCASGERAMVAASWLRSKGIQASFTRSQVPFKQLQRA